MTNLEALELRRQTLQADFDELKAKKKKYVDDSFEYFKDVLIFAHKSNPLIFSAFHWSQHTPYFNDGDPCYFGFGEFHMWSQFDQFDLPTHGIYKMSPTKVKDSFDSILAKKSELQTESLTIYDVSAWCDDWILEKHIQRLDSSNEEKLMYSIVVDAWKHASEGFEDRFGDPAIVLTVFENDAHGDLTVRFESRRFDHD